MTITVTETSRDFVKAPSDARAPSQVSKITIVATDQELGQRIAAHLIQISGKTECIVSAAEDLTFLTLKSADSVVYLPSLRKHGTVPDVAEAARVLGMCREGGVHGLVLVSSAAIYGASFRNPGLVSESYSLSNSDYGIASQWKSLEQTAKKHFQSDTELVILRCATVLSRGSANPVAHWLSKRVAVTASGHDPCIQLLSPTDLAQAIGCVLRERARGVLNVSPDGVIPLREALQRSGVKRIPVPRTLLRIAHAGRNGTSSYGDYARYPWTISNQNLKKLGFEPKRSSEEAAAGFRRSLGRNSPSQALGTGIEFDDFGMDKEYIAAYGRTLFRFLSDWYWRIEVAGMEHVPRQGKAVLAGIHRGFMPWDGVMALHLLVRHTGRHPRFLIHPGLVKFPFLANFMTKLGGIIACQRNAAHVLERNELLGVFPEGIQGAFVRYSNAYQIHDFHRDAFVKIALRHQAPIIPFVTVGSAEIFPILGKLKSRLWTKYSEWPAFPITPTFPLIPLPLPSKWHTRFLPAMHIENDYPPSAASNPSVVRAISREVKERMQKAIDEMLERRRSIFFGSIFPADAT
jgi:1-acyl-sn-glycerol-3-phosphate acyltransferase/nucleoside-diphosphate-sugar epimerase